MLCQEADTESSSVAHLCQLVESCRQQSRERQARARPRGATLYKQRAAA
ncbi:hypothetical protein OAN61_00470 [bacterium]|nr:hypothetical protein [bacterium]